MFTGRHDHALDDKGRSMVPKEFRAYLNLMGQRSIVVAYKPGSPGCLEVRTPPAFQSFQKDFAKMRKSALLERYAIVYFGSARIIEMDRTGRLLLPPELRDRLGLTDRVAFVGIDGERFQLWRPDHLDSVYGFCDEHADAIQDALGDALASLEVTE